MQNSLLKAVASTTFCCCLSVTGYAQSVTKIGSATAFLDAIGLDGKANSTTAAQLSYLGVHHLRSDGTSTSAQLLAAGAYGAKIDVITPIYLGAAAAVTTDMLQTFLSVVIDPAAAVVEAVEGPNEVNVDPDTFNGLKAGPASMEALQQSLYQLVQTDPKLVNSMARIDVYDFSVMTGTNPATYGGMQDYADYNNVHAYGGPGVQPDVFLAWAKGQMTIAGSKPYVLTETGAETMTSNGVDQPTQAEYEISALLDSFQVGFKRTYLFNIQDFEPTTDVADFSGHYGLYTFTGTKKLAARALHNFTKTLSRDAGPGLKPLTLPQKVPFSISGYYFYYTNYEYLQKPNGYSLVLWNEPFDWNNATHEPVNVPSNTVTITLSGTAKQIGIFDPLISERALSSLSNTSKVSVTLNTHPLIINVAF